MDNRGFNSTRVRSPIELEPDEELTSVAANRCLIGKIILDYPLREEDVEWGAREVWKCKKGISVSTIKRNMFMFCFQDKQDLDNVVLNVPWKIKGGLLILSEWSSGKIPDELNFCSSPFWVQVHGLPLNYFTEETGVMIGEVLGRFLCSDKTVFDGETLLWRKFLRIRVVLDIRRPLLTGHWVKRAGLSDVWVEFKYENLGIFCYKCGRIGNLYRSCKFPEVKAKFGPWISAPAPACSDVNGGRAEPETVEEEANPCTALIIKAPQMQIQSSVVAEKQIDENVKKVEASDSSDQMSHDTVKFSTGHHIQRLIVKCVDTVVTIVNCGIIYNRAAIAALRSDESNRRFAVVMAVYFLYLVFKFFRLVDRKSWLFKQKASRREQEQEHENLIAFQDIWIISLFLVILKFA